MNQNLSKLNPTSCLVEHTVAHEKFIYYSSQRYVIFMQDVSCNCPSTKKRRYIMKHMYLHLVIAILIFPLYRSNGQWTRTSGINDHVIVMTFAEHNTNVFAGAQGVGPGGVYLSTDNGNNWIAANTGLDLTNWVWSIVVSNSHIFAGTGKGVYLSTNNGTSWTASNTGLTQPVFHLAISGINLFAGTNSGIFLSTNTGGNWTPANTGLPNNAGVTGFAVSGSRIFAGIWGGGVFVSTNNGGNWTSVNTGLTNTHVYCLAVNASNLFAGTDTTGVYLSTNNGASWSAVNSGLRDSDVYALAMSGTNLFAGTRGGIFLSTNSGTSWSAVNSGLTDSIAYALAVSGTNLFAGTIAHGVWRRPLSEMITSVQEIARNELPQRILLEQNYPNPFNPSTKIQFSIPHSSHVILNIYNVLGQEIATLVSQELAAGTYSTKWSADGKASGIYYYRLQAGSFVETKKLVLLR
jgi:hypothetical protein